MGGQSSSRSGKGRSDEGLIKYGFSLVKGKANHPMEDYHVANFINIQGHELGLFAIYDGHMGDSVPAYLQKHLFSNILKEVKKTTVLYANEFRISKICILNWFRWS